ncbi:hypothetical protein Bca4012_087800 [Brassica carinata]
MVEEKTMETLWWKRFLDPKLRINLAPKLRQYRPAHPWPRIQRIATKAPTESTTDSMYKKKWLLGSIYSSDEKVLFRQASYI